MVKEMNLYTPKEIAHNYLATGDAKTKYPVIKSLILSIMAGIFIALAGVGSTVAQATVAGTSLAYVGRLMGAMVFPSGLVMVLLTGSELFTGNCLIIIPVLEKKVRLVSMLRNWLIVYSGNFIGSLLIALITVYGGTYSLFSNAAAVYAINTAVAKVSLSFSDALLRGVLCNVLVCVAVWLAYGAKDAAGKIIAVFFPVMLFVLCGYEHSIANMYFIPAGLLASGNPVYLTAFTAVYSADSLNTLTWLSMFTRNIIPSTIGNIMGGMVVVGMMNWFVYLRKAEDKHS